MSTFDPLAAALAERYRIERELGAGGMATVYLAEDLKHDRKVAVKVLRPELAAVLGADRFVQEIKTTASLQHPHILPLFDSGEADGFLFYVMPYIEGETLRDKLNRETQLGVEQAVQIATEVADALEYAHAQGVIHRDIKPENILLHNGRPMVADFGIALAVSAAAGGRMTETGMSLGTPHYMSPEQATAEKDLTAKSDIYSLASVLYEMLTGAPPHLGGSAQQIIMKIVTEAPAPVTQMRKSVPPNVAAAVGKALEKLPADRFHSASGFADALRNPAFRQPSAGPGLTPGAKSSWRQRAAIPAIVLAALFLVTTLWAWLSDTRPPPLATYDVGLPTNAPLLMELGTSIAMSRDGSFVVYTADVADRQLWYRSLTDRTARAIPGTEGSGLNVAIAPDGSRVAFFSGQSLKVIPIEGSTPTVVAEVFEPMGLRWISDTEVFFSDGDGTAIRWIDVDTGAERIRTTDRCVLPYPLPGGERVLCSGGGAQYAWILDLPTDSVRFPFNQIAAGRDTAGLLRGADFRLVEDRYLTYVSVTGDLRAVSFDPATLTFGRSIALMPGVRRGPYTGAGQYAVSETGTLVYAEGPNGSIGQMVSVRPGQTDPIPLFDHEDFFLRFDLSPDGRQMAVVVEGIREQELHIYDLETGQDQIWLEGQYIGEPTWTPAGDRLIVSTHDPRRGWWTFLSGPPAASTPPDTVIAGPGYSGPALFTLTDGNVGFGNTWEDPAMAIRLDLNTNPATLDTIVEGAFFATLSPDGEWLSYMQSQTGITFISPYPGLDRKYQVSDVLGEGQWSSQRELILWACCTTFFRTVIDPARPNPVTSVEEWFHDPLFSDTPGQSFTLTADGRMIYVRAREREPAPYLRVIPDWVEQMKRAVDLANR